MRVVLLCRAAMLLAIAVPSFGATEASSAPVAAVSGFESADAIVRTEMAKQHIPGAALAILWDGKLIHLASFGLADLEQDSPVRPDTAFNVGSLSKQFLAEGALLLVQDGKISLDAPVSRYLPDAPAAWSAITVRHLLSHTSGLVREAPGFNGDKVQTDIDVIRSAYAVPLTAPAGTRFEYSNLGYFILAEIISRASRKPWPAFFADRVFGPAGMTATRTTSTTDLIPRRARGYAWTAKGFENAPPFRALRPSGAFTSTILDLVKWEKVLARGGLAAPAARAEMWRPARLVNGEAIAYGFGWRLESVDGNAEIGHGGSLPGFRSYYARYPAAKLAIIVLTNNGEADARAIVRSIGRTMLTTPGG